jgi:hypothetical protein
MEKAGHFLSRLAVGYRPHDHVDDEREPHINIANSSYCTSSRNKRDFGDSWGYLTDYGTMLAVRECEATKDKFFKAIAKAEPDLIMLEHPWLWPVVNEYSTKTGKQIHVIHNSQNVESALKRAIVAERKLNVSEKILSAIEALERDCALNSVATTACTDKDRDAFLAMGARWAVTVANGADDKQRDHLMNMLPPAIPKDASYALVVGSDHPPNISGFLNLLAPHLPGLRARQRFVVVGGAGASIYKSLRESGREIILEGRFIHIGMAPQLVLEAVIANASVIALPIQYGGGSNVKTAEALLSGRRVVATRHSMRGFAGLDDMKVLRVVDDKDFGATVLEELGKPFSVNYENRPVHLLWENTTLPLRDILSKIANTVPAKKTCKKFNFRQLVILGLNLLFEPCALKNKWP